MKGGREREREKVWWKRRNTLCEWHGSVPERIAVPGRALHGRAVIREDFFLHMTERSMSWQKEERDLFSCF